MNPPDPDEQARLSRNADECKKHRCPKQLIWTLNQIGTIAEDPENAALFGIIQWFMDEHTPWTEITKEAINLSIQKMGKISGRRRFIVCHQGKKSRRLRYMSNAVNQVNIDCFVELLRKHNYLKPQEPIETPCGHHATVLTHLNQFLEHDIKQHQGQGLQSNTFEMVRRINPDNSGTALMRYHYAQQPQERREMLLTFILQKRAANELDVRDYDLIETLWDHPDTSLEEKTSLAPQHIFMQILRTGSIHVNEWALRLQTFDRETGSNTLSQCLKVNCDEIANSAWPFLELETTFLTQYFDEAKNIFSRCREIQTSPDEPGRSLILVRYLRIVQAEVCRLRLQSSHTPRLAR